MHDWVYDNIILVVPEQFTHKKSKTFLKTLVDFLCVFSNSSFFIVCSICLLFKILNYVGIVALLYSLYCCIYVLLHYNKVKEHEHMIKDLMSKNGNSVNIKKTVIKNLIILILCIPLAVLSFWYWYTFTAS